MLLVCLPCGDPIPDLAQRLQFLHQRMPLRTSKAIIFLHWCLGLSKAGATWVERSDDAWRGAHPPWGGAVQVIRRYKDRLGGTVTAGSGSESDTGGGDRLSPLRPLVRRCRQAGPERDKPHKEDRNEERYTIVM